MNIFDIILIQPIFNILITIYALVPGQDFGVAVILFTVLVRLAMWPLVKKQLNQTKVMRQLQPELVRLKKKAKGDRQLEARMMMELYKERGVNPFSSIGLLIAQLPIFIALFAVVNMMANDKESIARYTYGFLESIPSIQQAVADGVQTSLLGIVDLTQHASGPDGALYWPLVVMAVVAAILQFVQSKQLLPQPKEKRRLRDMLKDQAAGKEVDQSEMSALMTGKMVWLFPIITLLISMYLAGALVLYLLANSAVAVIQQARVLKKDETDLEKVSENTKTKANKAKEAKVVEPQKKGGRAKKAGKTRKKKGA